MRNRLTRRIVCATMAAAACLPLAAAPAAAADEFPQREIRFLNAFSPGGTSDLLGRILAEQLSKQLGQRVVVENRTGAAGVIATQETARSAPDGHTILLASMGIMTITPQIQQVPYDVDKDLTPLANVASVYNILVASPQSEIRTWQDLVRLARRARSVPGRTWYGSRRRGRIATAARLSARVPASSSPAPGSRP